MQVPQEFLGDPTKRMQQTAPGAGLGQPQASPPPPPDDYPDPPEYDDEDSSTPYKPLVPPAASRGQGAATSRAARPAQPTSRATNPAASRTSIPPNRASRGQEPKATPYLTPLRPKHEAEEYQPGAASRAASRAAQAWSAPVAKARPRSSHSWLNSDKGDLFVHLIGAGGVVLLVTGGFLTAKAFALNIPGFGIAVGTIIYQAYCRREAEQLGHWTFGNFVGFWFVTVLSSYFNLIGMLAFHNYTFDFRPLSGVLWKSTTPPPEVIEAYQLMLYIFAAFIIDNRAEPWLMHWWDVMFPRRKGGYR